MSFESKVYRVLIVTPSNVKPAFYLIKYFPFMNKPFILKCQFDREFQNLK